MTDVPERWISLAADAVVGEQAGYCGGYEGCGSFRVSREDSLDIATAALAPVLADLRRQVEALPHGEMRDGNGRPRPCPMQWPGGPCRCHLADVLALIDGGGSDG